MFRRDVFEIRGVREGAFRREGAAVQQPPVTVIGDLRHRRVAVFPNDSCPKIGEVMDMSPDGRGLLLKVSRETQPGSGYREGDVVYFAGSFVLKVIG